MDRTRKWVYILLFCVFLTSCSTSRQVNQLALAVVALPFKVVVAAVAAAIGAASGMGMLP